MVTTLNAADISYQISEPEFRDNTIYAGNGFVFQAKNLSEQFGFNAFTLIGEAIKVGSNEQTVFATGSVQMLVPQTAWGGGRSLIISCDDLHYDLKAGKGIATNATFLWYMGTRRYRITCAALSIEPQAFIAHEARFEGAHGSVFQFSTERFVIGIIPPDRPERANGRLEDVTMWKPTIRLGGVPVFWLPVLYRDFTRDYPWTRYRFGYDQRQKAWVDGWIGSSLPKFLGFHSHVQGRYSYYDQGSSGYGAGWYYDHENLGKGGITQFRMPQEDVYSLDGSTRLETRDAEVIDWEHQHAHDNIALYARYSELPTASALDQQLGTNEQFRSDYLADDLKYKPLARQGATVSWASPYLAVVADSSYRPNDERLEADREFGLQASTPSIHLWGPVHIGAQAWYEKLRTPRPENNQRFDSAGRLNASTALTATLWHKGFAIDNALGLQVLSYDSITVDEEEAEDATAARWTPTYNGGVRVRLERRFGAGDYLHTITPRLGFEINGEGSGDDDLPVLRFGDERDDLNEDSQFLRFDFSTALSKPGQSFALDLLSRWAIRDEERMYIDDDGDTRQSSSSLVELIGSFTGRPISSIALSSTFTYDGLRSEMRDFDLAASWRVHPAFLLRNTTTWLQAQEEWNYETGFTLSGNRYQADFDVTSNPGGFAIDRYRVGISRRAVDGTFGLVFTAAWDDNRRQSEESISFTYVWNQAGFY